MVNKKLRKRALALVYPPVANLSPQAYHLLMQVKFQIKSVNILNLKTIIHLLEPIIFQGSIFEKAKAKQSIEKNRGFINKIVILVIRFIQAKQVEHLKNALMITHVVFLMMRMVQLNILNTWYQRTIFLMITLRFCMFLTKV